jgi:hypothetical protein
MFLLHIGKEGKRFTPIYSCIFNQKASWQVLQNVLRNGGDLLLVGFNHFIADPAL